MMGPMDFMNLFKNMGAIQGEMSAMKERISAMKITGESGAGMVRVTVSGDGKVIDMKIEPELVGEDGKALLEELIISATNDALQKSKEAMLHEMGKLASQASIPGMENFFKGQ